MRCSSEIFVHHTNQIIEMSINLAVNRNVNSPALLTRPVHAHGMEQSIKSTPMRIRAPYLSHMGPLIKRMNTVPATEQMLDVQICCFVRPSEFLISGRSGAMANHMKKAVKNPIQAQWNARMCGRLKDRSLISVALSSWSGSILT